MKRALLLFAAFLGTTIASFAQVTSISVETFYSGGANPSVAGYPANHTTYRIYANTTNANDRVVVVKGDDDAPLVLNVGGAGIWNHPQGGTLGDLLNCGLFSLIPALQYDSYMTIGYTCDSDGGGAQAYQAEDVVNNPWQNQLFGTAPYGAGSAVVNSAVGGTWFVLPNNAISAGGASNKVLLAQITTDGNICGTFNLQVFPNYSGTNSAYIIQNNLSFGSGNCGTPGCTDPTATNFDPAAGYDNGLCLYPCNLSLTVNDNAPACANGTDGSIEVTATGNQSFVNYTFNNQNYGLDQDGAQTFSGLGNGTYTVVVRDTRFDNPLFNPTGLTCQVSQTITLSTSPLTMGTSTVTNPQCATTNDGCVATAVANYGGGTGTLTFSLLDNGGNIVQNGLSSPAFCGLGDGTYHFTVTDANACTATGPNFVIDAPGNLTLFNTNGTTTSCFDSADAIAVFTWAGGTGDIDFSLADDGIYEIEGNPANVVLNNLAGGVITLFAADENGCTASVEYTVPTPAEIVITPIITSPSCNGDSNGSIEISATGGTGTITYSFDGITYNNVTMLSGLAAGNYTAYALDASNCSTLLPIEVMDPAALTATADVNSISCNGQVDGSIVVTATGGTAPYAYGTSTASYTPSSVLGGLAAGSYDVYVADVNGCTFSITNAGTIIEPAALSASASAINVTCNAACNGQIEVATVGGTAPFTYVANNGIPTSNNPISGLCPGDYNVEVSDANGCSVFVGPYTISEPTALAIDGLAANSIDEDAGGNTAYTVSGGTAPYTYEWTGPNGFSSTGADLPALTEATSVGAYQLTVTDANGCSATQTITITGVSELGSVYSIALYPNPNNGQFVLNIQGLNGDKMTYAIVDNAGRVVFAKELGNVSGNRVENIDLTDVAAGFYHVQFQIGTQTETLRFVKQ